MTHVDSVKNSGNKPLEKQLKKSSKKKRSQKLPLLHSYALSISEREQFRHREVHEYLLRFAGSPLEAEVSRWKLPEQRQS